MSAANSTGTMRGREAFIAKLSHKLGRTAVSQEAPEHPFRGAPDFYKAIDRTTDEKIEWFTNAWTSLTGKVLVVEESEANTRIAEWLAEVCKELEVTAASRWEHEGLKALGLDEALAQAGVNVVPWKAVESENAASGEEAVSNWSARSELLKKTERCEIGIVWPDYAVANTGTLVLQCSQTQGRSVSLLTSILFAVFRADQLVNRMGEAFTAINAGRTEPLDYASSLNLITGPSRSADIENDLTIGIHGPGKVYAVIIK